MLEKLKQIFWILGIIGANGIIVLNIFFYISEFYTLLTLCHDKEAKNER